MPTGDVTQRLDTKWFRGVLLLLAASVLIAYVSYRPVADPDMFHEMALFRETLSIGFIPLEDHFAYTPTVHPVVHHEWGTGAVLYALWEGTGWGPAGILIGHFLIIAVLALGAFYCALRKRASLLIAVLLSLPVVPLLDFGLAPVRAQMFTYLFVVLLLLLLPREGVPGWRTLLLWLVLYLAWVNMHGGFIVGAGLFVLYAAEQMVRRAREVRSWSATLRTHWPLLATIAAMALLTLATPYGVHYPAYLWHALRMERPRIGEWAPLWNLDYVEPTLLPAFAATVLILVYPVARSGNWRELRGLPLVVATLVLTVQHQRLAPVYAIVWFCYVPSYLTQTPLAGIISHAAARWRYAVAVAACGAAVAAMIMVQRQQPWQLRIPTQPNPSVIFYPVAAAAHLKETGFTGNVMTPFNVGAYMSWMLHPHVKVSLDSRYEVAYPQAWIEESVNFYNAGPGWQETLRRYATDAVLIGVDTHLLAVMRAAQAELGWREAYRDEGFSIFTRSSGPRAQQHVPAAR